MLMLNGFFQLTKKYLPESSLKDEMSTFRSIKIDSEEFEFSKGFTDLHTSVYKSIISGNGFGVRECL